MGTRMMIRNSKRDSCWNRERTVGGGVLQTSGWAIWNQNQNKNRQNLGRSTL